MCQSVLLFMCKNGALLPDFCADRLADKDDFFLMIQ